MRSAAVLLSGIRRSVRRDSRRASIARRRISREGVKTRREVRVETSPTATLRHGTARTNLPRRRYRPAVPEPGISGFLAAVIH
jgi:hypothetical protein